MSDPDSPPPNATREPRKRKKTEIEPAKEAPKPETPKGLRLRVKIWTDPATSRRYLMPSAFVSDPRFGTMTAYAMTDDDTKIVKLTPVEWNALPFFFFQEDGPAPRAAARPVDAIRGPQQ